MCVNVYRKDIIYKSTLSMEKSSMCVCVCVCVCECMHLGVDGTVSMSYPVIVPDNTYILTYSMEQNPS